MEAEITEATLTNELLRQSVEMIEAAEDRVSEMKTRFHQVYGLGAANLLKEVLEQRKIARDAEEYARALLGSPDAPGIEE